MIVFKNEKNKKGLSPYIALNHGRSWSEGFDKNSVIPEKRTREIIDKILDKYRVWHFAPVNFGMGKDGVPDVICCFNGHFIGIEAKGWNTGHILTPAQSKTISDIKMHLGKAIIVYPFNLDELDLMLKGLM